MARRSAHHKATVSLVNTFGADSACLRASLLPENILKHTVELMSSFASWMTSTTPWTFRLVVDNLTPDQRRKNMSGIRSRNTSPERLVRSLIHRLGYRFRLHDRRLPGRPDIVLPRHRKIILVHGCFWHMHTCKRGNVFPKTNEAYWSAKRQRNVERDRFNARAYVTSGWKILVVWECETKDRRRLAKKLTKFLA